MDRYQASLFACACSDGNIDVIRSFTEQGVDIFEINEIVYYRLLTGPINANRFEVIEYFIEQDWDPSYFNTDGQEYFILQRNGYKRVRTIFIHRSAQAAGLIVVRQLLSIGFAFDVNENLKDVCERDNLELVKMLIEYGVEGDAGFYEELLHRVARKGNNVEIARYLFQQFGDKININNCDSYTKASFLHTACWNNRLDMAIFFLQHGANPNLNTDFQPVLHVVITKDIYNHFIPVLLKYGADVNLVSSHGSPPIHLACRQSNYEAIKILIQAGAKLCKDGENLTPEDYLCRNLLRLKLDRLNSEEEIIKCEETLALLAVARSAQSSEKNSICCTLS